MRKSIILLTLTATGLCSCGQSGESAPEKVTTDVETVDSTNQDKRPKPLTYYPGTYIDTESKYTDFAGKGVIIQNSLPKGGGYLDSSGVIGYTDPTGTHYGYAIFWTRVINETATPLVDNIAKVYQ